MPQLSTSVVFALIAFAGVFLFMFGIARMRRSAGGAEDFQARLAAYGVTTAGATALPPASGMRESLNRLFQPAADRMGRGDVKKGKPSVAEQLIRADLKLRTSEFFMIQIASTVLLVLVAGLRFGFSLGSVPELFIAGFIGYIIPGRYVKYRIGARLKAFNNQLGDTLTLLSNAIKAGYSFAQARETVSLITLHPIDLALFSAFGSKTKFRTH
jgi:Flp pilus assembly protein TadB